MPYLLVATDADWLHAEVAAALGGADTSIRWVRRGAEVAASVAERTPDLVILDLQIGNMGGFATCMNLRLEASGGRLPPVKIMMLLDRQADVFLARRSQADGWLVKPLTAFRLRKAVRAVLAGGTYTEGVPEPPTPPAAAGVNEEEPAAASG